MKRSIITAVIVGLCALALSACEPPKNSDRKDSETVQMQQQQYQVAQPVPQFDWSLERDIVIQLYQARNQRVSTHTVWRSDLGTVEGHCASIGYPVPYDTSLTNPLRGVHLGSNGASATIEQPEPNGIFASKNSVATWVRCVVEVDGKSLQVPIYIESKVTAYPFPVSVDYSNNRVVFGQGKPSVVISDG